MTDPTMMILAMVNNKVTLYTFTDRNKANATYRELAKRNTPIVTFSRDLRYNKTGIKYYNFDPRGFVVAIMNTYKEVDALRDTAWPIFLAVFQRFFNEVLVDLGENYYDFPGNPSYYVVKFDVTKEDDPRGVYDLGFYYGTDDSTAFIVRNYID